MTLSQFVVKIGEMYDRALTTGFCDQLLKIGMKDGGVREYECLVQAEQLG